MEVMVLQVSGSGKTTIVGLTDDFPITLVESSTGQLF
jgi:hypothetical protein